MSELRVTRYDDLHLFYDRAYAFLAAQEAEHCLIFGICFSLQQDPARFDEPPYLALVERGDQIAALAVRTPPYNLVLSEVRDADALDLIAADVHALWPDLPAAIVFKENSQAFAERWTKISGQPHRLGMAERIYRLEQVTPVEGVSGSMRPVAPADVDLLREWFRAFENEIWDREPDMARVERMLAAYTSGETREQRGLMIWEDGGQAISMTAYMGPTPNGMRIGLVYTPPELRRRGYASALVAAVSQHVLDMGRKFLFLFTDLGNPTSNHIYQQIGYQPVCDVDEYRFG